MAYVQANAASQGIREGFEGICQVTYPIVVGLVAGQIGKPPVVVALYELVARLDFKFLVGKPPYIDGFCPDDPLVARVKAERTLSDEKQRAYMIYLWDHGPFDIVRLSDLIQPEDDRFVFWLCGLEDVKHYTYFGEFMSEATVPFLRALCDRLSDPDDVIPIMTNRYYSKVG